MIEDEKRYLNMIESACEDIDIVAVVLQRMQNEWIKNRTNVTIHPRSDNEKFQHEREGDVLDIMNNLYISATQLQSELSEDHDWIYEVLSNIEQEREGEGQ